MTTALKTYGRKAFLVLLAFTLAFGMSVWPANAFAEDETIAEDPVITLENEPFEDDAPNEDLLDEDEEEPGISYVNLMAVGDNLVHPHVRRCAYIGGTYNFDSLYANLLGEINAADISVINQETVFTKSRFSGFPRFATPRQIADSVAGAGFDVVEMANNHIMDKGTSAIKYSLNVWRQFPNITTLGAYDSKTDYNTIRVVESNGVKIAMLNYTKSTNGIKIPSSKYYMVDKLTRKTKMAADIKKAKAAADFVVVFMHDGTEYKTYPSKAQKSHAKWFADHGVDLIVGTHPHVVEPVKWVTSKDGHRMLCYYSLGNYVANHLKPTLYRIMGGMARIQIAKDNKTGETYINGYEMVPLVIHKGTTSTSPNTGYTVYKLAEYTPEMAKANPFRKKIGKSLTVSNLSYKWKRATGLDVIS